MGLKPLEEGWINRATKTMGFTSMTKRYFALMVDDETNAFEVVESNKHMKRIGTYLSVGEVTPGDKPTRFVAILDGKPREFQADTPTACAKWMEAFRRLQTLSKSADTKGDKEGDYDGDVNVVVVNDDTAASPSADTDDLPPAPNLVWAASATRQKSIIAANQKEALEKERHQQQASVFFKVKGINKWDDWHDVLLDVQADNIAILEPQRTVRKQLPFLREIRCRCLIPR
jgi:hypothetical protein